MRKKVVRQVKSDDSIKINEARPVLAKSAEEVKKVEQIASAPQVEKPVVSPVEIKPFELELIKVPRELKTIEQPKEASSVDPKPMEPKTVVPEPTKEIEQSKEQVNKINETDQPTPETEKITTIENVVIPIGPFLQSPAQPVEFKPLESKDTKKGNEIETSKETKSLSVNSAEHMQDHPEQTKEIPAPRYEEDSVRINEPKTKAFDFRNFRRSFQRFSQRTRLDKRKVGYILTAVAVLFFTILPFYMGTVTYPLAIVNGNSMYPKLQNGDLVVFHAVANPNAIPNGTIVVYVNTETGVTGLDALTKPIVIHRVIGEVTQSDGSVNYVTKGDNNLVQDSALVPANHVIGTPYAVIPKVGLIFVFLQSPQGLVAVVGIITIVYLAKYEDKGKEEKKKEEAFLAVLARMALNNELTETLFKKMELAVKYFDDLKLDDLTDASVVALVDWLKRGGIVKGWKLGDERCSECGSKAQAFESKNGLLLVICPKCQSQNK